jgi:hypothetical protein
MFHNGRYTPSACEGVERLRVVDASELRFFYSIRLCSLTEREVHSLKGPRLNSTKSDKQRLVRLIIERAG